MIEGDGEILDWRGGLRDFHVDAGQIVVGTGIGGAPFAGLFADDESPFAFTGDGEDGVLAGWHGSSTDSDVGGGGEGGGFIGTGAPDLSVGNEAAKNFAAFGAGAGVIDGDGFAIDFALGFGWWARAGCFVLLSAKRDAGYDESCNQSAGNHDGFTHIFMSSDRKL